jgi:hypothetical protein
MNHQNVCRYPRIGSDFSRYLDVAIELSSLLRKDQAMLPALKASIKMMLPAEIEEIVIAWNIK